MTISWRLEFQKGIVSLVSVAKFLASKGNLMQSPNWCKANYLIDAHDMDQKGNNTQNHELPKSKHYGQECPDFLIQMKLPLPFLFLFFIY